MTRLASFIWSKLGNCRVCIRKAWLAVVIALTVSVVVFFASWHELLLPSVIMLLGSTALWLAHLVAFAGKLTGQAEDRAALAGPVPSLPGAVSRRQAIPFFMSTMFLGVVMSVAPRSALAQSIVLQGCGTNGCRPCLRSAYQNGQFLGCFGCHSCGNGCTDGAGTAFPNGC